MLPVLASLDALEGRAGVSLTPDTVEGDRAQAALEDASSLVRTEADRDFADDHGELDWGALEQRAIDTVQQVVLAMAVRVLRNPDGVSQTSVGDVSVSFRGVAGTGAVFMTRAERRLLRRALGITGASSITLEDPWPARAHKFVDVVGSEQMIFGPLPWEGD